MCINPRKRFNLTSQNDYCVWDIEKEYVISEKDFLSKGKSTPFLNKKVYGECVLTIKNGKVVYEK